MRSLQQEFVEISDNLKASLQQRMKFEIAERIISESRVFFFLRLFLIQQQRTTRAHLEASQKESPALQKLTPLHVANQYKKLMFELINHLRMAHHTPGQLIVRQNEEVLDEFGDFLDDAHVYFIMTGNYKVQSLMYAMANKLNDAKSVPEDA